MAKRGREPGITITYLKNYRRRALMTQAELGEKIGRTKATISLIESGKPASITAFRRLAEALHVTPDELLHVDPGDSWEQSAPGDGHEGKNV